MAEGNDIAWKPIAYCVGAGIAGILIGAFLIAPAIKKAKDKKAASKTEKPADGSTTKPA